MCHIELIYIRYGIDPQLHSPHVTDFLHKVSTVIHPSSDPLHCESLQLHLQKPKFFLRADPYCIASYLAELHGEQMTERPGLAQAQDCHSPRCRAQLTQNRSVVSRILKVNTQQKLAWNQNRLHSYHHVDCKRACRSSAGEGERPQLSASRMCITRSRGKGQSHQMSQGHSEGCQPFNGHLMLRSYRISLEIDLDAT